MNGVGTLLQNPFQFLECLSLPSLHGRPGKVLCLLQPDSHSTQVYCTTWCYSNSWYQRDSIGLYLRKDHCQHVEDILLSVITVECVSHFVVFKCSIHLENRAVEPCPPVHMTTASSSPNLLGLLLVSFSLSANSDEFPVVWWSIACSPVWCSHSLCLALSSIFL